MSSRERRIAPRKSYAIPVRFNVVSEQYAMVGVASVATASGARECENTDDSAAAARRNCEPFRAGHRIQDPAKSERWRNCGDPFYAAHRTDRACAGRRALQRASSARGEGSGHKWNDVDRRGN
jgi:hypothetical protein